MIKLFGVGGHAKVVVNALNSAGESIEAVYDDNKATWGVDFCGYSVVGGISKDLCGSAVAAIGIIVFEIGSTEICTPLHGLL